MIYLSMNLKGEDESRFARKLLNKALLEEYGRPLSDFEITVLPGGKPVFRNSDICFNISHTKNAAAVALSDSPVGVDLQWIYEYNPRLADRICTQHEKKELFAAEDKAYFLYACWAMRESYVKFTGEGMRKSFRDIPCNGFSHTTRINENLVLSVSPAPLAIKITELD